LNAPEFKSSGVFFIGGERMLTRRDTEDILSMSLCMNTEYMQSVYNHFNKLADWLEKYQINMLDRVEIIIIKALISAQVEWCDVYDGYDEWVKAEMEKEEKET
jgi:hypothetical protein